MQKIIAAKPVSLVMDKSPLAMSNTESPFLRGYRIAFNRNQFQGGDEGGNLGVGTGYTSTNLIGATMLLPPGTNMAMGSCEVWETNSLYVAFWNSNGNHGIYRIDGKTLKSNIVIVDPRLSFSPLPEHQVA